MASPPRVLIAGKPSFITFRVEEGLPFVARRYMEILIKSAMARAQELYDVEIIAFLWMSNHVHILLRAKKPEIIPAFIGRIKTETGHAVNRLLGRRKRTVWCNDYDSPPLLMFDGVIDKLVYLYTNPQAANLVDQIEEYPGVSSWKMFMSGKHEEECKWIQRPHIAPLPCRVVSDTLDRAISNEMLAQAERTFTLRIDPLSWIEHYGFADPEEVRREIIERIREREKLLRLLRKAQKKSCCGADQLKREPFFKPYTSKKWGKRMWCICSDVGIRISFIIWVKNLLTDARAVYENWKKGDFSVPYPIDLFPPAIPRIT